MVPIPRTKLRVERVDRDDNRRMMSGGSDATHHHGGLNKHTQRLPFHPFTSLVAVRRLRGVLSPIGTN